jgi:hypothetical protein
MITKLIKRIAPKITLRSMLHFYEMLRHDKKEKTRKLQGENFSSL